MQHVIQPRPVGQEANREPELLDRPMVADLHTAVRIHHHDALAHVLERHFEQCGLLRLAGFTRPQLFACAVQPALPDHDQRGHEQQHCGNGRGDGDVGAAVDTVSGQDLLYSHPNADDQLITTNAAIGG